MPFARTNDAMHFDRSLCEQQVLNLNIALTQACCQPVVCTAALISEDALRCRPIRPYNDVKMKNRTFLHQKHIGACVCLVFNLF